MSSKHHDRAATIAGQSEAEAAPASGCAHGTVEKTPTRSGYPATIDARPLLNHPDTPGSGLPAIRGERVGLAKDVHRDTWARLSDEVWRRTQPRVALSPEWTGVVVESGADVAIVEFPYRVTMWEVGDAPMLWVTLPTWAIVAIDSGKREGGPDGGVPIPLMVGVENKDYRLRRKRRTMLRRQSKASD